MCCLLLFWQLFASPSFLTPSRRPLGRPLHFQLFQRFAVVRLMPCNPPPSLTQKPPSAEVGQLFQRFAVERWSRGKPCPAHTKAAVFMGRR